MDYYHGEFIRWKDNYTKALQDLREMEYPKQKPTLIKSWKRDPSHNHPRDLVRFFQEIDSYIKYNQSSTWVYVGLEENVVEEYTNCYDDCPEDFVVYDLYVILKDKSSILGSDVYKQQIKDVENCLVKLNEAKERFVEYMKDN